MSIASAEIRKIAVETYLSSKATPQQLADILRFHRSAIVRWVREYKTSFPGIMAMNFKFIKYKS